MKQVELNFYGYTWEEYAFQISGLKGIFIVYKGRLDPEGLIELKEVLYIGYHKGLIELYDQKIIESIKQFITSSDRIFLSYAEVPLDIVGSEIASMIIEVVHPKHSLKSAGCASDIRVICKGSCNLIPEIIEKR